MRVDILRALQLLLWQEILLPVRQQKVRLAIPTTDVRPKHDVKRRLSSKPIWIESRFQKLDVATTTVNELLVLNRKLNDKVLILVGEL
jgi:hypothetical protein